MFCQKCSTPLTADNIAPYLAIDTATELRINCECGATFYAFVQHTDWHDCRGDSVDLGVKPKPVVKLTRSAIKALAMVGEGCDVMAPKLAFTLRAIQKKHPDLIWIGAAMGRYSPGEHHPYFGAKLTKAGALAIAQAKKGGAS